MAIVRDLFKLDLFVLVFAFLLIGNTGGSAGVDNGLVCTCNMCAVCTQGFCTQAYADNFCSSNSCGSGLLVSGYSTYPACSFTR